MSDNTDARPRGGDEEEKTEMPTAECSKCGEIVEAKMFNGTPSLINAMLAHHRDHHTGQSANAGNSD